MGKRETSNALADSPFLSQLRNESSFQTIRVGATRLVVPYSGSPYGNSDLGKTLVRGPQPPDARDYVSDLSPEWYLPDSITACVGDTKRSSCAKVGFVMLWRQELYAR